MSILCNLPECKPFKMQTRSAFDGLVMHEGYANDAGELMLVTRQPRTGLWRQASVRGVAYMRSEENEPTIEWSDTPTKAIAAYSRGLKHLGWKGSLAATTVYGNAN